MRSEELIKKIEREIKEKKTVCLIYLQFKYVPEHSLDEDYHIDFDVSTLNTKIKKIVLGGFTEDTVEVFKELYRRYGFVLYCPEDYLNPGDDAVLYIGGGSIFWTVPGKPNHLLIMKVKPLELYSIKLLFCVGCRYRSECTLGLDELPPLYAF